MAISWGRRYQQVACSFLALVTWVAAQELDNVYTTPQDYSTEHTAGNLLGLFCDAPPGGQNPYPGCESNYWLSFSEQFNMDEGSLCGQCLQLTNTADGGGSIKACIVDQKQAEGFDLDLNGFKAIDDPNGDGNFNGHMVVNAKFVDC